MRVKVMAVLPILVLLAGCAAVAEPVETDRPTSIPAYVEGGIEAFRVLDFVPADEAPLAARVTASSETSGHEASYAVDGEMGYDAAWSSQGGKEQWIQLDFNGAVVIERIVLVVSQPRTAETHHELWARDVSGDDTLVAEIRQETFNQEILEFVPAEPLEGIAAITLVTLDTPSLAAWEEILVFGSPQAGGEAAGSMPNSTILFFNGVILTMNPEQPRAEAILVEGERITFVGDEAAARELAGDDVVEMDLTGHTLMPGFIDAHNHVFDRTDFWGTDLYCVQAMLLANGITTMADAFVTEDLLLGLMAMDEEGELHVRTSAYMVYGTNCGEQLPMWWAAYPPANEPGDMLRWDAVKLFTDGGSCGGPAFTFEHGFWGYGDLWYTQDQLNSMLEDIDSRGYQAIIHALGDRGTQAAIDAIAYVLDGGENVLRHRIEHNATVSPDQDPLYSEQDIVVVFFGAYPSCGATASGNAPGTESWEWPYTRILAANPGLHAAWHSDAPYIGPPDPIAGLYSMVTDYEVAVDGVTVCESPDWLIYRDFTVDQALPMMTIEGAYALHREDELGSLEAGKLADLVVLSADPTAIPEEDLLSIDVLLTMVGGETAYCGDTAMCP
ncbi:MAG: amidohydrolase family protein [Anaerolineales bacterium]|nr:amidohydrolase family protein [Anaerolineales bacterium]